MMAGVATCILRNGGGGCVDNVSVSDGEDGGKGGWGATDVSKDGDGGQAK
jgi:hypothetical protein